MSFDIRTCGANLNYWWPLVHIKHMPASGIHGVRIGPIEAVVVANGQGEYSVFDDACPHKRVRLSRFGRIMKNELVCFYHGWRFERDDGHCTSLDAMRGKPENFCLKRYPSKCYGNWVWAFLGDPAQSEKVAMPVIAPAEAHDRYHPIPMEGKTNCHFSFITENATDLYHAELHKAQQPWANPELKDLHSDDRTVRAVYEVDVPSSLALMFGLRGRTDVHVIYEYPYIHIYQKDHIFYLFVTYLPLSPTTTYVTSTFFFRHILNFPLILKMLHPILNWGTFRKVFAEDIDAVDEEQRAYLRSGADLGRDTNPVTHAIRKVIEAQTSAHANLSEEPQMQRGVVL